MNNKINDSLEIISGRRGDWRENTWPSVDEAKKAITGIQRLRGQKIPVELSGGNIVDHHWVNNELIPYDGRINQPDSVLVDGFSLNDDKTVVTLEGTEWRINDNPFKLSFIWEFGVPAPDGTGLIRIDRIKLNSSTTPEYMVGEPGISAVAKPLIYGELLLADITVSLASTTVTQAPISSPDGEVLFGATVPAASLGKAGDVYIVTTGADKDKRYKKKTISGVTDWVLEFTPDAGGASSFASLTGAPGDNTALNTIIDALNDDIIAAQAAADVAQDDIDYVETNLLPLKENKIEKDATGGYAGLTLFKINFKNALNTFTSFFTNANTAARTYTFPDKSGTLAMLDDLGTAGATIDDTTPAADKVYSSNKVEGIFLDQTGSKLYAVASGINTYTASITPAITAYTTGQHFYIRFSNANTGVSTINLNGLGAKNLFKNGGFGLSSGNILANQIYTIAYDGTNFQIEGNLSGVLPTVTSGEKVVTVTSSGGQAVYDTAEQIIVATPLTAYTWVSGSPATVTGLKGQTAYDANYRYDCISDNTWRRSALNGEMVDLYLADIDDTAGAKTSAQLQTTYPASVIGQRVWGTLYLYEKKTDTLWRKMAISAA